MLAGLIAHKTQYLRYRQPVEADFIKNNLAQLAFEPGRAFVTMRTTRAIGPQGVAGRTSSSVGSCRSRCVRWQAGFPQSQSCLPAGPLPLAVEKHPVLAPAP